MMMQLSERYMYLHQNCNCKRFLVVESVFKKDTVILCINRGLFIHAMKVHTNNLIIRTHFYNIIKPHGVTEMSEIQWHSIDNVNYARKHSAQ